MAEILSLKCPSCGAKVESRIDSERFDCSYCGVQFQIERKAGEISLTPLTQALKTAQSSMDRSSSEMAIVRIKKEIDELQAIRAPLLNNWNQMVVIQQTPPEFKSWTKALLWSMPVSLMVIFITALTGLVPIAILALLVFLGAPIGLIINGKNARKRKQIDKDYSKMYQFMVPLNEQIDEKYKELEIHQNVVKR